MGPKKYNGQELDERTGACLVGHGFGRDTKTLKREPNQNFGKPPGNLFVVGLRLL